MELTSKLFHHVVPDNHDCMGEEEEQQQQFPHKGFWRVKECLLFKQAVRSVEIDHELNENFAQILDSAGTKVTMFMNLFW